MAQEIDEILIEDAKIFFLNFSGRETDTNAAGSRNFCVELDPGTADDLSRAGWNVKMRRPREEGDPELPFLNVSVGYKIRPPLVAMITSRGRTLLNEEMVELLDMVDIKLVDIIVKASKWERHGRSGIKAYLKTMFVTVNEDYLELKYADVPEANG